MHYDTMEHKEPPMTDLQKMVFDAIRQKSTDKERTSAAIHAVAMWHFKNGNFHDAYTLNDQNQEVSHA